MRPASVDSISWIYWRTLFANPTSVITKKISRTHQSDVLAGSGPHAESGQYKESKVKAWWCDQVVQNIDSDEGSLPSNSSNSRHIGKHHKWTKKWKKSRKCPCSFTVYKSKSVGKAVAGVVWRCNAWTLSKADRGLEILPQASQTLDTFLTRNLVRFLPFWRRCSLKWQAS